MLKTLVCLSLVLAITFARTTGINDYRTAITTKAEFLNEEWKVVNTTLDPEEKGCVPTGTIQFSANYRIPYMTSMKAEKWHGQNCSKLNLKDNVLRLPFEGTSSWKDGLNVGAVVSGDLYYYFSSLVIKESTNVKYHLNIAFSLQLLKNAPAFKLYRDVAISSLRKDVPYFLISGNWTAYRPVDLSSDETHNCCVPQLLSEVMFFENKTSSSLTNMFAETWVGSGCNRRIDNTVTFKFEPRSDFKSVEDNMREDKDSDEILFRYLEPEVKLGDGSQHESIQLYQRGCEITLIRPTPRVNN